METGHRLLQEGRLGSGEMDSAETLIAETHHSIIARRQWQGAKAVIKRCRHQADPRTASRFLNELEALKLIGVHENITQLLDANTSHITLTLRFEPGQSLDRHVDADMKSTLPPSDCAILWTQMSGVLAHLHDTCSLIHDDVKPENIIWDPVSRNSVLIDFGAALNLKVLPEEFFNPSGTPPYAPPEYLRRRKGREGDVWALGVAMLFALGRLPLPNGDWILPEVFEKEDVRREMVEWLDEVEGCRTALVGGGDILLAEMLEPDFVNRIGSGELVRRLGLRGVV
ncbi:Calcium-dependent protein kinase 16 [Cytospora mali]|uniref:Calcium-dependent protein kinase 16 n=1 Tax=Cytospora mali TaxID=578113 RepID=A0A194WE83_CYTMA|nr:Calcium-dependent protein kinase 16 [Valsa mali]